MIFGSYPCCGADLAIVMPDQTPAYLPESCPSCGARIWHVFSRLDPMSYTEADFLALYEVDESAKTVKLRNPEPELMMTDAQRAILRKTITDYVLYGESTIERPVGIIATKARVTQPVNDPTLHELYDVWKDNEK